MTGTVLIVVIVMIIVVVVAAVVATHNQFVAQRATVEQSWRQVDVQLQRRHELIGNLIDGVKAGARLEQSALTQIVQARSQAMATRGAGPAAQFLAEQQLNGALSQFFAVLESRPELSADQGFGHLRRQIIDCDDRVAAGRHLHNGNVRAYNARIAAFPSGLVAGVGKFTKVEYYEVAGD